MDLVGFFIEAFHYILTALRKNTHAFEKIFSLH